jgi:hypothetical protein
MKLKLKLKLAVIFLFVASSYGVQAQNYHLGTSKDGVYDYHILSVTVSKNSSVKEVHTRVKPGDGKLVDFRAAETETARKMGISTDGFDKLMYLRRKVEYHCKAKKYRIMECIYYDMKGKEITSYEGNSEKTKWEVVPAGTMREVEFNKICSL